ncbi:SNARE-like superfamily protein [Raphanus sativus]|uniref:Phytolongin Phyl2.1 n=1 Tax=Raphanus sativus TaxID=3726 RepID=A0A6J0N358_RAPSA|nr:phytolongin Phyl2.1 [Raphanus sativus]KAJ4899383.1 SNARE-like superfamily protein [Raphanus sativus]
MITNPRLLFYSCIAKGTVILAEFSSKDEPEIESIALRCIESVPPHHSMISHTVRKRTYALIIDRPFTYLAILDEAVTKTESLWLFTRLKSAVEALVSDGSALNNNPTKHCLQSKLDPVFAEIATGGGNNNNKDLEPELGLVGSPREIKNPSLDSSKEQRSLKPLLAKPLMVLKKNKKRLQTEAKMDVGGGGGGVISSRGLPRNGLIHDHHHRQKAKQIWKKHVWVVLMFDVCICVVLFGIWLWVCQGFQCIQG